ncbi:hypothetical protein [Streptomyces sp. NPDC097610]|uniref:hypothetical protein n=1 Tax=Streptomyces sp. NPDC097610 TaxID=3157227 RepID=UPI0033260168
MSVKPVIQCDGTPGGPGTQCPAEGKPALPWHSTATKVRRFLHTQKGWHRTRDGRDICPLCREEGSYKPGRAPSPSWCGKCSRCRPCWCDVDEQDPDPFPLPGEDPDEPWDGNPETVPEAVAEAIGL